MNLYHNILYINIYSVSRIAPVNDTINMFLYQYLYTNNKFTVKNGGYTLVLIAYRHTLCLQIIQFCSVPRMNVLTDRI